MCLFLFSSQYSHCILYLNRAPTSVRQYLHEESQRGSFYLRILQQGVFLADSGHLIRPHQESCRVGGDAHEAGGPKEHAGPQAALRVR
jgi:hypothetical protein